MSKVEKTRERSVAERISASAAFWFLKWQTTISRPMQGHPRRSWNSGSGFLSVVFEFRIPIASEAGFRIP